MFDYFVYNGPVRPLGGKAFGLLVLTEPFLYNDGLTGGGLVNHMNKTPPPYGPCM